MHQQQRPDVVNVRVSRIGDQFLTSDAFVRMFSGLPGCLSARLEVGPGGERVGILSFVDITFAQPCCAQFNGWRGWGMPGIALEILGADAQLKRPRDAYERPGAEPSFGARPAPRRRAIHLLASPLFFSGVIS